MKALATAGNLVAVGRPRRGRVPGQQKVRSACSGRPGFVPDLKFRGSISSVPVRNVTGLAIDDRYFYLADGDAGAV